MLRKLTVGIFRSEWSCRVPSRKIAVKRSDDVGKPEA